MGILSGLYRIGLTLHRGSRKIRGENRLPARVISIGNITVGGTGKTPAVMKIAERLKERGLMPCILTRGYRSDSEAVAVVSRGDGPLMDIREAGDEPYLMAEKLRDVPIVKGKDRYSAGLLALKEIFSDQTGDVVFILDDGFQHHALHRDIDIVLVDSTNPFGNNKLIPEGTLREPLSALRRADIIMLTKTNLVSTTEIDSLKQKIRKYNNQSPLYLSVHSPQELINCQGEKKEIRHLFYRRVFVFSGIANPMSFESLIRKCGAQIIDSRHFSDHRYYSKEDVEEIKTEALGLDIITTEKDLIKLCRYSVPERMYALRIEFSIEDKIIDEILGRLQ